MTSEIRANTLKNRVGLGTVSYTNTGIVVSGIVTANSFSGPYNGTDIVGTGLTLTSTDAGSSAAPIIELYRNSASPADADYLGQIKFTGEDAADNKQVYAKITGKADDVTNLTEDGILEFMLTKAGSNNIAARFTSTDFKLINGTGLEVAGDTTLTGDLDVDRHTNLDNVSIAGVTTAAGSIVQTSGHTQLRSFSNPTSGAGMELGYDSANRGVIQVYDRDNSVNRNLYIGGGNVGINQLNPAARLDVNGGFKVAGAIDANGDLDVDGHTNLDNLSIAGVSTFTGRSDHSDRLQMLAGNAIRFLNAANSASTEIKCDGGARLHITSYNQTVATFEQGSGIIFYTDNGQNRLQINNNGNVSIAKDLDVDGHTNLDNVSIAGITTFTNQYLNLKPTGGGNAHFRILSTGSGDAGIFFDAANGDISGSDYVFIGQKNNLDFVINPNANAGNIDFQRAGTTNVRIDSDGKLLIGTQNTINSSPSKFQVAATDATGSAILSRFNASVYSSYLDFYKSRSNTLGTAYVVNDDDHLGAIRFYGADGSNSGYTTAAEIYGSCDGGSGSSGDMPGRITFHTRPDGAGQSLQERLRIDSGGKFKFPSVKAAAAHGESTADVEIGGRHIWNRITSTNHVTTSTSTNHFYLAFWRNSTGNKQSCYYRGVVVNVVAGGNYDWSGHGYVTHSSQTILSFGGTTTGVHNTVYNQGHSQLQNNAANMQLHNVAYSYDGTYLYANFRFKSNESGTGWRPHYNVEVIDPSQITYTCAPLP